MELLGHFFVLRFGSKIKVSKNNCESLRATKIILFIMRPTIMVKNIYLLSFLRGFVLCESFFEMCHALGITSQKNSFKDELSRTAYRASFVIWLYRFSEKMFKNPVPFCDIPTNMPFKDCSR